MDSIKIKIPEGYEIDKKNSTFEEIKFKPIDNCFEYLDLGLPSGTLWATCNVGADTVNDNGDYLTFDEACKYELPKKWQFQELIEECRWERQLDKINHRYYMNITGKNGISIILPATGFIFRLEELLNIECGYYWSSTVSSNVNYINYLGYTNESILVNRVYKGNRLAVRPIKNK